MTEETNFNKDVYKKTGNLLSVKEAAELLGNHPNTIRRWEKETKIKAAVQALTAEKKIPSPEAVLTHLGKPSHFFKGLDEAALRKLGLIFPEKEKAADEKYRPILEALAAGGKKFETVREIAIAAAGVPESYVKELGAPKLAVMGLLVGGRNP